MKNIVIIGAGELGSRHLQGVLKSRGRFNVFVVDPSDSALQTANARAEEVLTNTSLNKSIKLYA